MTDARQSSDDVYAIGYGDEFIQVLKRRSAKTHAAHLLPYLHPGTRLLDFGCGPGTISLGLAEAIEPGEMHGVDIEESQIELARSAAAAGGHDNAVFHVGDVTRLPFEDNTFDVAHSHGVLNHVPDTQAVLAEVKRVLKPHGVVSSREFITDSCFAEPEIGNLTGLWSLWAERVRANGGHPQMGKELPRAFREAGLSVVQVTASFESFGSAADVAFFYEFWVEHLFSLETMETDIVRGRATPEQFEEWRRLLDEWKDRQGAFAAFAWGETIGQKP